MKSTPSLFVLSLFAAGACGGSRLLVGMDPAGNGGSQGSAGTSVTGSAGTSPGQTGNAGAAPGLTGSAGTAGATSIGSHPINPPLPISGLQAITRIAQVLWSASPDGDVLVAAQQGQFMTASDLVAPIHTMLADARAATGVGKFYRWWLNLDAIATTMKDPLLFPAYTPALQADLSTETEMYAVDMTLTKNGTYKMLMTSATTFVDARTSDLYGTMIVDSDPEDFVPLTLDPTQRAGLLTQPALQVLGSVATRNSPPNRGTYVVDRFLCRALPSSPPGLPAFQQSPGTTLRQSLADAFESSAACGACHLLIDGPGLAFETFDAIGRFRTTDNGLPVDVSGLELYADGAPSEPKSFSGPIQLAADLAASTQAQQCMAQQWLAYVTGMTTDQITDADVGPVFATFGAAGLNLQELIVAVLTSDLFLAKH